jgi:FSR family fosmidomycin resistance protein-like MFS transporter
LDIKLIAILSASHFLIDLTGTAIPAIMPLIKKVLALSYTQVGMVIMLSSLTSSIVQPCFGYLSDRGELKWLLPVSTALAFAGFSCIGVTSSYAMLAGLVMLQGFGVACDHPEGFKAMHYFSGTQKGTGFAIFQVGGNLGLAFGPLLVMYAVEYKDLPGTLLFLVMGLPMVALLLFHLGDLTSPMRRTTKKGLVEGGERADTSGREQGVWASMSFLVAAVSLRSWAHMGLIAFVPFYYTSVLGGEALTAGKLIFAFLMGGVLGTLVGGVVADKIGYKNLFCLSLVLSFPLLLLFLQATGLWVFIILFLVGIVLISSFSVTVVMGQEILKNWLGTASGLMLGLVIGVGGVGAGLLGMVADRWGVLVVLKLIVAMPAVALIPALLVQDPLKEKASVAMGR